MKDLLEGLLIISKYEPNSATAAEHDEIYAGGEKTKNNATAEEKEQLKKLGWMWIEEYKCYQIFT